MSITFGTVGFLGLLVALGWQRYYAMKAEERVRTRLAYIESQLLGLVSIIEKDQWKLTETHAMIRDLMPPTQHQQMQAQMQAMQAMAPVPTYQNLTGPFRAGVFQGDPDSVQAILGVLRGAPATMDPNPPETDSEPPSIFD